jgi:two-component system sensor kinase FixL
MDAARDGTAQSAALLEAVIDTAVDGIVIIDAEGRMRTFNKAAERLFGFAAAEVRGRNVSMLMPSPDRERHDSYIADYKRTGERKIIGIGREVVGRRKDGTTFPMDLAISEVKTGGDHAFVGIVRDLTERKRAEAALAAESARLRTIMDTSPGGIVVIDERGIVEEISAAAQRIFGYSAAEVLGRNVSMLMPTPDRDAHDKYIARYLATGEKRIIGIGRILTGRRKDGATFPMELAVGEAFIGGRRIFTGFVRDITLRQASERRIAELQAELLHISRVSAVGAMGAALAHELNQPLAAATNYLNAVRRWLAEQAGPGTKRMADGMERALAEIKRTGEIIRRLRDFVEQREIPRVAEPIGKVVEEAVALALVGAEGRATEVRLDIAPDLPPVAIDRVQVQQVLTNLIRNAVEAMTHATERRLIIDVKPASEGGIAISVADSGPGLAPHLAKNLFKPFVTTKRTGMGVGLSICKTIIEAHGGRITVESSPGRGATFRFTLPAVATKG